MNKISDIRYTILDIKFYVREFIYYSMIYQILNNRYRICFILRHIQNMAYYKLGII